jgi:hypothetical protein
MTDCNLTSTQLIELILFTLFALVFFLLVFTSLDLIVVATTP